MGLLGKLGKWVGKRVGNGPSMSGLKSSVKGTGKLAAKVAPYAAFVPGVGPIAAAALAAGGNLAAGKNIGESLMSGASTFGAGKLAGLAGKIPGVSALGSKLGSLPGASAVSSAAHALGDIPGVSEIGGFLKDHAGDILTGAQGLQAFNQQQGADSLRDKGLGYATSAYDEKAPLRAMALEGMQNEQLPDLSSIYGNSGNVYAKPRPIRGVTPLGS